jgi:hypothetical protein
MQNTVYKNSVGLVKAEFPTLAAVTLALFLAACGGGEEDTNQPQNPPVLKPPENGSCQTTYPVPSDCPPIHK